MNHYSLYARADPSNITRYAQIGARSSMEDFTCVRHILFNRDATHVIAQLETLLSIAEDDEVIGALNRFGFFTADELKQLNILTNVAQVRTLLANNTQQLAAVFDGHSGEECAARAADELAPLIIHHEQWAAGDYEAALRCGCEEFAARVAHLACGSTACIVVVATDKIFCANIGDSRAVAYWNDDNDGEKWLMPIALSEDHKIVDRERARILAAGGLVVNVTGTPRLMNNLAISRAFGDAELRPYGLIAVPDVSVQARDGVAFVVVASDGVWDVQTEDQVCRFFYDAITAGSLPEKLFNTYDNACLILIQLK